MPPLPISYSAALFTGADLKLEQALFARFLAREWGDTIVGRLRSSSQNPLAVWLHEQVAGITKRRDWQCQVTTALVTVVGPVETDEWHTVILATPRWAKDWLANAAYHHSRSLEVTAAQARRYLPHSPD